jgi:hypothetical protein
MVPGQDGKSDELSTAVKNLGLTLTPLNKLGP